jgi:hypothetical protein
MYIHKHEHEPKHENLREQEQYLHDHVTKVYTFIIFKYMCI